MHTWKDEVLVFFFMDSDNSGHPKFENSRIWMLSSHVVIISNEFKQNKQTNKTTKQLLCKHDHRRRSA